MADRYLDWYIDTLTGDGTTVGPVYTMDRNYRPRVVRIHAKRAPDAGALTVDIKDDGVTIFSGNPGVPRLEKGTTHAEVAEDFPASANEIARYSKVSLDLTASGAAGITVTLELASLDDEGERAETDT